ncbi:glycosyltransferase family A protein [Aquibacillus kalidii]|uniref:glycosyltransferase family A protein n=1 Tax=Aquibacillus kalidii TaxID=2762597 RepID=UPI001647CE4E|nr:glycosyltransferase family A protein [Aquibacillus kalidii]
MKDITVILVDYSEQSALLKAIESLNNISSRIESVLVFTKNKMNIDKSFKNIKFVTTSNKDKGQMINEVIPSIPTSYVLFLEERDYLDFSLTSDTLEIPYSKNVLTTHNTNNNVYIHRPLLIHTSFLKRNIFPTGNQLPFKEALFPIWLTNVEPSQQIHKEGLLRQSRQTRSATILEKEKQIQKYQVEKKLSEGPSLTVIISNYNMGKYVEAAVASCQLQMEPFEQILIIDDGSTDNSYHQLLQLNKGKNIKVFHKSNGGKARALNYLLPFVDSEFILELDADDWLDADAVTVIKGFLNTLPKESSVLYGNLRKWKQLPEDVLFKRIAKGVPVNGKSDLLSYRFPLGPRIYRTSTLKEIGGFPVIEFADGRLYEDVSVLNKLITRSSFQYHDFTVYNVREHEESITKNNNVEWDEFLRNL